MVPIEGLAARRQGAGPRIVLAHGFTQNADCWGPLADDLAIDHEVIRVDLPGHGASSTIVADVADGARRLGLTGGAGTYLGYSLGGRHALALAVERPDLVEALVVVGATAGIEDPSERSARAEADDRLADRLEALGVDAFLTEWLAQPLFAGLDARAGGLEARRTNSAAGMASSLRHAGTGRQQPGWHQLGQLAMPVLVVVGARDERYRALGEQLVGAIGASARLAVLDGVGHACHLEDPDGFLAVLRPWLARHRA